MEIRKRNRAIRKRKSVVAIGCEGNNKTEKIYYSNFASRECILMFSTGNSTDPIGMVNDLVNFIKKKDIKIEYGDSIYLVLDTDINKNKQKQIEAAKKICNKEGIKLITSTPTFELWYILHFGFTTKKYISSQQLKKDLKNKIINYNESLNVYPLFKDKLNTAILNAKQLEEYQLKNEQQLDNENCNPYTAVYKVVEDLIKRNNNRL
jgi:hypothetical protein